MTARDTNPAQPIATERLRDLFSDRDDGSAVAVVDGHGVRLNVDRAQLRALDGVADAVRHRSWSRATHGLSRVAVMASSGDISISALRWCRGAGVGLVVVDPFDGEVLATSAHTMNDDPRLRRAQALALGTSVGLHLARNLVVRKLEGQAKVADTAIGNRTSADSIRELIDAATVAPSIDELRQTEAVAGGIYFAAWHGFAVRFARRDESRVPPAWKVFDGRRSAVNPGTSRSATDPLNAALNWSYRLLEAETRLACIAVGLDPGIGVMHADVKGRDSMVLDVMEPLRPAVDRYVLSLLARRPLRKADLSEDARGVVRLRAPLTWELAQGIDKWRHDVGRLVEEVADLLGRSSPYDVSVPTVLTRAKHRQAARTRVGAVGPAVERASVTGGTNRRKPTQRPRVAPVKLQSRCQGCGDVIAPEPGREVSRFEWCPTCLPERRRESARAAQRQSRGRTGNAHDAIATERRRAANAEQRLAEQAFELAHVSEDFDREWYLREVLPGLALVSTTTIAKATGMSTSAASKIRAGKRVPHPRWWSGLSSLSE